MNGPGRFAPLFWLCGSLLIPGRGTLRQPGRGGRGTQGSGDRARHPGVCVLPGGVFSMRPGDSAARTAARRSLAFYGLAALGLLLYPLTMSRSHRPLGPGGRRRRNLARDVDGCLGACLVGGNRVRGGAATGIRLRGGGGLEPLRVRAATAAAASLALAVAWVFAVNYTASERDRLWEWSARSRVRASEATRETRGRPAGAGGGRGVLPARQPGPATNRALSRRGRGGRAGGGDGARSGA